MSCFKYVNFVVMKCLPFIPRQGITCLFLPSSQWYSSVRTALLQRRWVSVIRPLSMWIRFIKDFLVCVYNEKQRSSLGDVRNLKWQYVVMETDMVSNKNDFRFPFSLLWILHNFPGKRKAVKITLNAKRTRIETVLKSINFSVEHTADSMSLYRSGGFYRPWSK